MEAQTTYELHNVDAIAWLKTLPYGSVDLVMLDSAYESLEKHRAWGTKTRLKVSAGSSNAWFDIFPNARFPELFEEVYRVLRNNSHFYFMCDQETMFIAKPIGESVGFRFWKPIIWDKVHIGMGYHYRCTYEVVLFFEKGKRKLNDLGVSDILRHKRIQKGRPTEKPVALLETLIQQSSSEHDIVIDPFMGSGSTGAAALRLGRRFAGTDISLEAVNFTRERLDSVLASVREEAQRKTAATKEA